MLKFVLFLSAFVMLISCNQDKKNVMSSEKEVKILEDWYGNAISYSGYRKDQDPRIEVFPTKEQVKEDLKILGKNWNLIRTYGVDQHAVDVLEVIKKENLNIKVMLGIWLDGEPEYTGDNEKQVERGIKLATEYNEIVIAINVGNESQIHWSDHKVPNDKLISYIKQVQGKVSVPVTTADTWDYWIDLDKSAKLIDAVDFIAMHTYPIWGGLNIDQAMSDTKEVYNNLQKVIPDKKIIITEAGWASYTEGELHAPQAGSEENQKIYFNELMKWSEENKIIVFWFEAFDEPWKGTGTEGYWGLFTESRKAKLAMHDLYPNLITNEKTSPTYE